jgi:hypothetical protein
VEIRVNNPECPELSNSVLTLSEARETSAVAFVGYVARYLDKSCELLDRCGMHGHRIHVKSLITTKIISNAFLKGDDHLRTDLSVARLASIALCLAR